MKPIILYAPNTTNFDNNGIGVLAEAISPIVTEERNGIFELSLSYPISGKRYNDIQYSYLIRCSANPDGDYQTFRIYAISKPINGIISISAEHVSYQLSYIPVNPFTATSAAEAMVKIKTNAMTECPFTFWTDKNTVANYKQEVPENIRSRLGGVQGSILDVYGGEYEFDNYTVKLYNNRGTNRGTTLRYGKNITDIEQEENISTVYTSIVGYWKNEDTLVKTAVINSQYANAYPYNRTKVVDFSASYQEPPTVEQLTAKATSYMSSNNFGIPHVSIKVSFAALWQTEEYKNIAPLERVYLCDTVSIYFEKLGIRANAKVVKTIYNVMLNRYDAIELGEARTNLEGRLANNVGETAQKLTETKSELEKSIERATALITGNRGGYIITRMDANGKPTELLIMDTDDVNTARKVWRFNLAGWGYSSTGINGPFRLAATQDGHIVADFIDTGVLTANIIKAGILTDTEGLNYWNMQTGEFKLTGNAKVDNSTIASKANVSAGDAATLNAANSNAQGYAIAARNEAITQANTNIAGAVSNYDEALNQLKIFNKLTNNGQTQGIYLTDNKLYINAEFIKTGILYGETRNDRGEIVKSFALNMNTGDITMHNGAFSGNITASSINGSVITGTIIQNAERGARILMDDSSSLKGFYDNDLHNIINMSNRNGLNNDLIIDADHQLHIRTPKIYVAEESTGTGEATVYETLSKVGTGQYGNGLELVTHVSKNTDGLGEYWLKSLSEDEGEVLCILPVFLNVQYAKYNVRNGLWTTDNSTRSEKI